MVLLRLSQIADFARTVSEDPQTFGCRVHRLVFACLLPEGVFNDVQYQITRMLFHCRSLSYVSFAGFQDMQVFGLETILQSVRYGYPEAWQTQVRASRTTFIVWRVHIPYSALTHLRSLQVSLWSKQAPAYANKLELPLLDTLILQYPWGFRSGTCCVASIFGNVADALTGAPALSVSSTRNA